MAKKFDLDQAIVVSVTEFSGKSALDQVGEASANYLRQILGLYHIFGVTWGSTVYHVVSNLQPVEAKDLTLVQIGGGLGTIEGTDNNMLTMMLGQKLGAKAQVIPAPVIVRDRSIRDTLFKEKKIQETLAIARKADLVLFGVGAIAMRAAGCTYNDIVDREIDAQVARTRSRPLPSGQVSVGAAIAFMLGLCLVGLAVLLSLNSFSIWLGFGVVPIVMAYPFMKRVSHWPQAVLGLAFNWGALIGWAAVLGSLDAAALVLYAGAVAWTIGYDTIYAHQDREEDALIGMRSTALRFGAATKTWLSGFYTGAWAAILIAGLLSGCGGVFLAGMGLAGAHLAWQVVTLDVDDSDNCLRRFRANRDFGLLIFVAVLADMALATAA